jgi:hypothetical protein
MTIEVDDRTAKLLSELRRQAEAKGIPLSTYLESLLKAEESVSGAQAVPPAEFNRLLDELSADLPPLKSLPDGFSRADIYYDHD